MSLREGLRNGMTAFMAAAITFLVLELGLRLYHGEVFDFVSELRPTPNLAHMSRADYHPQLGWVPSVGATDRAKSKPSQATVCGLMERTFDRRGGPFSRSGIRTLSGMRFQTARRGLRNSVAS